MVCRLDFVDTNYINTAVSEDFPSLFFLNKTVFFHVHRFVVCPLGCGAEVRQENLWEHTDDKCPLRRSPCEACGVPLPLESHPKHLAESCIRVPRRCTNGVNANIKFYIK